MNCLTGNHVTAAMLPLDYETDREILNVALSAIGLTEPAQARLMRIRNTLDLKEVECSQAYLAEAKRRSDLELLTEPCQLAFDQQGNFSA
jgi:hypothetical protein